MAWDILILNQVKNDLMFISNLKFTRCPIIFLAHTGNPTQKGWVSQPTPNSG